MKSKQAMILEWILNQGEKGILIELLMKSTWTQWRKTSVILTVTSWLGSLKSDYVLVLYVRTLIHKNMYVTCSKTVQKKTNKQI